MATSTTSFFGQMNLIMEDWAAEHDTDIIDVDRASDWAISNNRYQRVPMSLKQQCMRDMRRALQHATYVDPQGNKVRTKHAIRGWFGEQLSLYIDIRTARPDMMMEGFRQSFAGIENDVKRHAIEKQSYDLNNPYGVSLPLFNYDFNALAEVARTSGEYDDSYDDEDNAEGDTDDLD